jgi:hypothetical protein
MLDFCRPWHTSWLWIWSERAVEQGAWILRWRRGARAGCAGRTGCWRFCPWMFVGSKCSDTAGRSVGFVQRGAGCLAYRRNRVLGSGLERTVGCSTWNRMFGSGGGGTAHGAGCAGRRGRWRLHPDGMLGFLARGTSDVSCGPALRIRARRALGCSLEVSTPIQQDRSVGLFSAEPDVWTWAGLPSKPSAWSGLERPCDVSRGTRRTRRHAIAGRSDVPRGITSGGARRTAQRPNCGWATVPRT